MYLYINSTLPMLWKKNIPEPDALCPLNQWQTIEIPNDLCGKKRKKKENLERKHQFCLITGCHHPYPLEGFSN